MYHKKKIQQRVKRKRLSLVSLPGIEGFPHRKF